MREAYDTSFDRRQSNRRVITTTGRSTFAVDDALQLLHVAAGAGAGAGADAGAGGEGAAAARDVVLPEPRQRAEPSMRRAYKRLRACKRTGRRQVFRRGSRRQCARPTDDRLFCCGGSAPDAAAATAVEQRRHLAAGGIQARIQPWYETGVSTTAIKYSGVYRDE